MTPNDTKDLIEVTRIEDSSPVFKSRRASEGLPCPPHSDVVTTPHVARDGGKARAASTRIMSDPVFKAHLEEARTEGYAEGFACGFKQAVCTTATGTASETAKPDAKAATLTVSLDTEAILAALGDINLIVSEAVEEAVEKAEAEAAAVHLETLRALEDDHEKHIDLARKIAREEAQAEGAGERGKLWRELLAALEEVAALRRVASVNIRTPEGALVVEVMDELARARAKFPGKNVTFAALVEEVGELSTALFSEARANVRAEAVQVAVMALRVVLDGDHTFDAWRDENDLDRLVGVLPETPPVNVGGLLDAEAAFLKNVSRRVSAAREAGVPCTSGERGA